MSDSEKKQDQLQLHNHTANIYAQTRAVAAESTSEAIGQLQEAIANVSASTYQKIFNSIGGYSDPEAIRHRTDQIESDLRDIISEEQIPVECVYVSDLKQGMEVTLAQQFTVYFDVSKNGHTTALSMKKGSTLKVLSDPYGEVQIQNGDSTITLERSRFPESGLLIEKQAE
ncbi:MAG: hypothetical protein HOG89_01820 [Candidatus Peribacter sp.]|jgi:hypothetical protein|nr:hypothetical protein [Candidatus Peribacter sp.]MBT4392821.1 hypothetical protein [Candidatus Peribacter sp.]MBT4601452.1 hypothetical protein [Candidatus Peribacter sp.]MBT5148769.1 hypothetical protein [Candidatus Peribacter sp.]MBT5637635.1 hypothetical protein [Candidatus Peribacter sp.]